MWKKYFYVIGCTLIIFFDRKDHHFWVKQVKLHRKIVFLQKFEGMSNQMLYMDKEKLLYIGTNSDYF